MNTSETKAWRKRADSALSEHRAAGLQLASAKKTVESCDANLRDSEEANKIVQAVAETIQEEAHERIAGVVSRCLAAVFAEPYEFQIRFERARGRTEANLVFVRDGAAINPLDASGGGVVDVAAFALRLSSMMLARPAVRRTVILDEPFKFVSADRRLAVRAMLEGLAEDLGVQFIMVTHIEELRCGHVVEIEG